eukprot:3130915-Lingulodinium_polyedra.AAC.1
MPGAGRSLSCITGPLRRSRPRRASAGRRRRPRGARMAQRRPERDVEDAGATGAVLSRKAGRKPPECAARGRPEAPG